MDDRTFNERRNGARAVLEMADEITSDPETHQPSCTRHGRRNRSVADSHEIPVRTEADQARKSVFLFVEREARTRSEYVSVGHRHA